MEEPSHINQTTLQPPLQVRVVWIASSTVQYSYTILLYASVQELGTVPRVYREKGITELRTGTRTTPTNLCWGDGFSDHMMGHGGNTGPFFAGRVIKEAVCAFKWPWQWHWKLFWTNLSINDFHLQLYIFSFFLTSFFLLFKCKFCLHLETKREFANSLAFISNWE